MELADWPDLAPVRDRGQRQSSEGGWVENFKCGFLKMTSQNLNGFFVLGYITTSMVLVSPSVKICDFLFFFLVLFFALLVCQTCQNCVKDSSRSEKDRQFTPGIQFLINQEKCNVSSFPCQFCFLFFFDNESSEKYVLGWNFPMIVQIFQSFIKSHDHAFTCSLDLTILSNLSHHLEYVIHESIDQMCRSIRLDQSCNLDLLQFSVFFFFSLNKICMHH